MLNIKMQPTDSPTLSPKIAVIGVGGAGGNAVNNMISSNLEGCEFIVCNTDAQALTHSLCDNKVQLGTNVTGGLGAGSKPEIGKAAAEESLEEVMEYLDGANMAFVTAGMGGGTGTGAAPVIARACRERGILTVGVVTKPFHFEGSHRMKMAEQGLEEMQDYVDTLIVIPNQNLFRVANEKTTFADAFRMADGVLQSGVRGVTDLMVRPGLVNLDFADIRTAMLEMGKAMMGTGEAEGEKRAIEAAEAAINNPLLDDVSMKGAHGVIINVTGGYDMTLFEADEACNRIRDEVDPSANIIFGATFDESLEGSMRVSIVATGIEREAEQKGGRDGQRESGEKPAMQRAQPNTVTGNAQTSKGAQGRSVPSATPAAYSAARNVRGITAPVGPHASSSPYADSKMDAEPEQDMFEQQKFTALEQGEESADSLPKNTILRGTRYKDSFIPPKPLAASDIAAEGQEITAPGGAMAPQTASFHSKIQGAAPTGMSSSSGAAPSSGPVSKLQLNPPRQPSPQTRQEKKRSPSFLERITGTVQQHLEGVMEGHHERRDDRRPPSPQAASYATQPRGAIAGSPAQQGSLNIDTPAAQPKPRSDDELDIPAFLRRQAN